MKTVLLVEKLHKILLGNNNNNVRLKVSKIREETWQKRLFRRDVRNYCYEKQIISRKVFAAKSILNNIADLIFSVLEYINLNSKSVFKTQSNIKDGALCENSQRLSAVNRFLRKLHLRCVTEI